MPGTPAQIAETLANFYRDFGATDRVAKAAAKRMKISESVALNAARAYRAEEQKGNPNHERQVRESAERLTARANAAEEKGLRGASLQELEAVAVLAFGG
jgi:hypothetical protein